MKRVAFRWSWPAEGSSRISVCGRSAEGDRDRQPLLLAERERQRRPLEDVLHRRSSADALEDVGDERVESGLVEPEVARPEEQLLADRPGEQHLAWALEDVAEDGGERRDGALGRRLAVDEDDARRSGG